MDMDLTKGSITQHIKNIAIPASIGMLFNTFYNVVDTFYSGKISTDALAGLTVSFPVFFIMLAISMGIGSGATALSAIALGKKDVKVFHDLILNSLLLGAIVTVIIMVFAPFLSDFLFKLSGVSGDTYEAGTAYMNTLFIGAGFFIFNFILNAVLNAQGDTKSYRNILIVGFFLNLILDPMFIYGWLFFPKLGVVGIALATIIVQGISVVYLIYRILKSSVFDKEILRHAKIKWDAVKDLLKQGIPSSLNMATIAIGVYIINFFIIAFADDVTLAGFGAAVRIEQIALLPALGLNTAALTISGQNFGAGLFKRIEAVKKKTIVAGVGIMAIGAVIIYPLADVLISIFNSDIEVVKAGAQYLRIEVIAFPTYVILGILLAVMQGIKKPNFAVYIGLYRQIIMPIPLFYLLGEVMGLGVAGIWWGIVFLTWSSVFITYIYSRKQLKKLL